MAIAWPAFLLAAVLEMLVFAVVDPGDLHGLSGEPLGWTRLAVYTVSFFVFWAATAVASALTMLLVAREDDPPPGRPKADQPPRGAATRAAAERGGDDLIRRSAD